jgi:hypothetical protein
LPKQPVQGVDCGLHDALNLFIGDVRILLLSGARGAGLARMKILNGAIAKSESGDSFRFKGEDRIKRYLHGEPPVLAHHIASMRMGLESISIPVRIEESHDLNWRFALEPKGSLPIGTR